MSALSKLDKLMYSIGIVDKVTGPINGIMGKINKLKEQSASAQEQMTRGLTGAAGGAMMLVGIALEHWLFKQKFESLNL